MRNLFLISILVLSLLSCNKDDKPTYFVKINPSEIVLSSAKKQAKFTITSNDEWYIESPSLSRGIGIPQASGGFYILSQSGGTGNATITVMLKDSISNDTIAKETLTVKGIHNEKATILLKKE